jgi:DNA-binding response OmpR family regulator
MTPQEARVLEVLASAEGRVVPRRELIRRAGLHDCSPRRCEAVLVGLRRALGDDAIHNVRGRGWRLAVSDRSP